MIRFRSDFIHSLSLSLSLSLSHTHTQIDLSIRLDHKASIFQNLNGATDEVNLMFTSNSTYAYNSIYDTTAVVYHGNGPSKVTSACKYM